MNETLGKVVGHAIEALKSRPEVLALLLFNFLIFGGVIYEVHAAREAFHTQITSLLDRCLPK